jgi:hypothetical protein
LIQSRISEMEKDSQRLRLNKVITSLIKNNSSSTKGQQ